MEMKHDMTSGSIWKGILVFSIPLIISNVLQQVFNMADIMVVGSFSGDISLGAVGCTSMLITLFTGFAIGMGNGINAIVARYIGSKDSKLVHDTVHTSFVISLILGLILFIIAYFSCEGLLTLMKTKEVFMDKAVQYLKCYFIGLPALAIYNFGNGVYSAAGNTKKPLIFLSIAGALNIGMNLLFVIVFKLDVVGVGMSSAISQYVSAILIVIFLFLEKKEYGLKLKDIKLYKGRVLPVLKLGIPSGFQMAIFAIANMFIQSGVNELSEIDIEGNSACATFDSLVYDVMAAFYAGCASFISQNYGAGNKKRMLKSYYVGLVYSFGIGLLFGLCLILFGRGILHLFTSSDEVIASAMRRMLIMGFTYCFSSFMDCTIAANRGIGHTLLPTVFLILGSCVFRVIWVYTIFAYFHTIQSLYLLYVFSWVITGIAEIIYFFIEFRKIEFDNKKLQLS